MTAFTIILFIAYLAILIYIGIRQAHRNKDMESYWMADRGLSVPRMAFCLAASWFGLSSFTGQAGWLYSEGMGALLYLCIPNVLAILIIGIFLSRKIREVGAISQAEMLEMRYSSAVRPPLAVILLIAFAGYSAMEFIAMSYVFETFFGWPGWIGGVIIIIATMIYVNIGGMHTVVLTEVIQYVMLLIVGFAVAFLGLKYASGALASGAVEGATGATLATAPHIAGSDVSWWNFFGFGIGTTLLLLISYLPAFSTEQDPWQRVWMARDSKTAYRGSLLGALFTAGAYVSTILMAVAAFGVIGSPEKLGDYNYELVVYDLMEKVVPHWLIPIILVGFMAAAMSNISNFSSSSASNLVKDVYQRYFRPQASQKEMVRASRICVTITLAAGGILGFILPSILDAVLASASLATCGYAVPIIGALFWRRGNEKGALCSFILGSVSYILFYALSLTGKWSGLDPVIIGLIFSLASYIIISYATGKPKASQLVLFFNDETKKYINDWKEAGFAQEPNAETADEVIGAIDEFEKASRMLLRYNYTIPGVDFEDEAVWKGFVDKLLENKSWCDMSGYDIVYKIVDEDIPSNIRLARGYTNNDILLYCEPEKDNVEQIKKMIALAVDDVKAVTA